MRKKVVMKSEKIRVVKEAIMVYLKVLFRIHSEDEKTHENHK
jgi:hypothetical protein